VTHVHHSAIHVQDIEVSLRFYRDGLGLEVLMDHEFDGDWPTLFGATADRLHSVFLGDPGTPDTGIVELVAFDGGGGGARDTDVSGPPRFGFFLLSFLVDVDTTVDRLSTLGFEAPATRIRVPGPGGDVEMATVRDPDGVLVELVGAAMGRKPRA
jgi:catechol 2,3-dioxygenase-like lactoylglutathione lyase family enzyme